MERKIGEIFEHEGEWYQYVGGDMYDYCRDCPSFKNFTCVTHYGNRNCCLEAKCKKLEKVGEPYVDYHKTRQMYKLHTDFPITNDVIDKDIIVDEVNGIVSIVVKQNQEDMEEKKDEKLSNSENIGKNLKPFDLEAARNGKPVCTRDGRKARIICFDVKDKNNMQIIALVQSKSGETEVVNFYYKDGKQSKIGITGNDLMMLPEKHKGWINIIKEPLDNDTVALGRIYYNYENAVKSGKSNDKYVATVKIEWEE